MKHILFFLTRFPGYGGIETVTELIGCYLIKEGYSISIITLFSQSRQSNLMKHANYYKLPNEIQFDAIENINMIDKIICSNHFDVAIFQDSYANWYKMICDLCEKNHLPLYIFEHNTPLYTIYMERHDSWYKPKEIFRKLYWHRRARKTAKRRKLYLLNHCNKYILLSKRFIPEFCDFVGIKSSDKLYYINNPITYAPINKTLLGQKKNIILTVCRINYQKRVNVMIDIWKKISGQLSDWKFIIVGDGEDKAELMNKVSLEGIQNIDFVSFTNPTPYYESAKIFWMTSTCEGWGMTLIEAMQKGCVPIVFQSFSSVFDIIDNKENGFIVNDNNILDFEKSTLTLVKNPSIYKMMAESAIKKIEKFDIKRIIEDWKKIL